MIMKKIKLKREVTTGIFAVAMILLLYWGINFIKGTDLIRGTNTYYALYDQVDGLQRSSPIVVKGFKVGVINKIAYDPEKSDKVVLELSVKSKFRIPANSRAVVFSDGLLSGKAIKIEMGDSPVALHDGDTLRSDWDTGILDNAGSDIEALKQRLGELTSKLGQALDNLNGIMEENSDNLALTFGSLARMSASLEDVVSTEANDLKGIVSNLNSLSGSLSKAGPKFDRMMVNMESFSSYLASERIRNTVDSLSVGVSHLNAMLDRVNSGQGTVGKLMNDEALYDSLTEASGNLARLLEDLRANPKRYVHFSLFGGGKNK